MSKELKSYTVSAVVTISVFTQVKAGTPEQAVEIASGRPMQGFCHYCSGGAADSEWSITGELDGEACDLSAEEDN